MQDQTKYQQLQPEDRMTIASMTQQGSGVRAMARVLGRSAQWPAEQLKSAAIDKNTVLELQIAGREYHLVRAQGVQFLEGGCISSYGDHP